MLKKMWFWVIVFFLFPSVGFGQGTTSLALTTPKGPFGVFFAPHFESGRNQPGGKYQETFWPRLVELVKIADKYNFKITFLFTPQWADFLLSNPDRMKILKGWQGNGHEIGLHFHGLGHTDWCGYTNRLEASSHPQYAGNVAQMMEKLNKLAEPSPVVSACCGPDIATQIPPKPRFVASNIVDDVDFPPQILYDIDGVSDGIAKPLPFIHQGKLRFHLRHGVMVEKPQWEERKKEIENAEAFQIVGLVGHIHDLDLKLLEEVFLFLKERNISVETVSAIMKKYRERMQLEIFRDRLMDAIQEIMPLVSEEDRKKIDEKIQICLQKGPANPDALFTLKMEVERTLQGKLLTFFNNSLLEK